MSPCCLALASHAYHFHLCPQTSLEGTPGGSVALRRRRGGLLRVGLSHVRDGDESLRSSGIFGAGFFLGHPCRAFARQLVGTLWNARFRLTTAMLFAIGFISLFVAGGLSGLFLARHELSSAAVNEDFVVGHFHLVMGVAATFAMLGALFFWFPTLFGRRLNETLGKIHFWATFVGVYGIFMPLHWLGLLTQSRMLPESQRIILAPVGSTFRTFVAVATICTVAAQILFIYNLCSTLSRRQPSTETNPWRATTLEWVARTPAAEVNLDAYQPTVYRGAYEFHTGFAADFAPQHLSPELLVQKVL